MTELIARLRSQFPDLSFSPGEQFCWSPETRTILYRHGARGAKARWSLLHETGHALLGHTSYKADFELLRMEVDAWERAQQLATTLDIVIDADHIQDCLDTYRDWLHKRSICPNCRTQCPQQDDAVHYRCYNCHTTWKVSMNRFGRSYRAKTHSTQAAPVLFS